MGAKGREGGSATVALPLTPGACPGAKHFILSTSLPQLQCFEASVGCIIEGCSHQLYRAPREQMGKLDTTGGLPGSSPLAGITPLSCSEPPSGVVSFSC